MVLCTTDWLWLKASKERTTNNKQQQPSNQPKNETNKNSKIKPNQKPAQTLYTDTECFLSADCLTIWAGSLSQNWTKANLLKKNSLPAASVPQWQSSASHKGHSRKRREYRRRLGFIPIAALIIFFWAGFSCQSCGKQTPVRKYKTSSY